MYIAKYLVFACLFVAGCEEATSSSTQNLGVPAASLNDIAAANPNNVRSVADTFAEVVRRVEPAAERECRSRAPQLNCDFLFVVDDRPDQVANSFQTQTDDGQPIIAVTLALLVDTRNADELAFVLAYGTANHIGDHLRRQRQNATQMSEVFGQLSAATEGGSQDVQAAQELGLQVGARINTREFVLAADRLGTIIAAQAGFDPVRGAEYILRTPSPEGIGPNAFPSNAERVRVVSRTAASL